jgi:hypothetical protein
MFYTEALFFTCMIFCFVSIYYKRHIALSLLIIPLVLLRPNGIVLLIPMYLYFLERIGVLSKFKIDFALLFTKRIIYNSLAFLTGPITFSLFCVYQYTMTGYFFAFSIAQKGWYREFMFPVLSFFRDSSFNNQFHSVYTIIIIVYAFLIRKKLPISLNALILLSLLFPLCSGSVLSMSRFISLIFPMFIILSSYLYNLKIKHTVLFVVLILHLVSYGAWILDIIN